MITLRANCACNLRYTPGAKKPYIARLTGRDSKVTFAREFIGATSIDVDEPGIYECRAVDKKGRADECEYVLLLDCPAYPDADGETINEYDATKAEAMKICKALDEGRSIDAICACIDTHKWELMTKHAAESKQAAETIDAVIEACWEEIHKLPEKDAKKVLADLRARVSPPKITPAVQALATTEAPTGVVADAALDAGTHPAVMGMETTPAIETA